MNNITVTVNLSDEDRARLDKIIDALTGSAPKIPEDKDAAQLTEPAPQPELVESLPVKDADSFADRLAKAMDAAGKKQIDLANETGLDKSAISRYLSGGYEPKHEAVRKLSKALGVSEMYLLGYDVVQPEPAAEPQPEPAAESQPEPAPQPAPAAPQHTRAELQHLVVTLTSAGKKAEVRAIVLAVAPKISGIPEDKIDEVFEQLKALEGANE